MSCNENFLTLEKSCVEQDFFCLFCRKLHCSTEVGEMIFGSGIWEVEKSGIEEISPIPL